MNCEEFKDRLESAVENHQTPDFSEAREHLRHCKQCRRLSEEFHIIERAVEEWIALDDAPDLSGRVLTVLAGDREPSRRAKHDSARSRLMPVLVGLSLVVVLFLAFFLSQQTEPNSDNVAEDVPSEPVQAVDTRTVEMDQVLNETVAAYDSLVGTASESFRPLKEVVTRRGLEDDESPHPEGPPAEPTLPVPKELVELNNEFSRSLGFLGNVLPKPPSSP